MNAKMTVMRPNNLAFEHSGFAAVSAVLAPRTCEAISRRIRTSSISGGTRNLLSKPWCSALVERLRRHADLSVLIPSGHVAIQCTYFEKSVSRNWVVAPHQDLSVPVATQVQCACLGGWSRKEGAVFVQPPEELLGQLVAVRLHLEPCTLADGPLRVVPGSHRLGRLPDGGAAVAMRHATQAVTCTAEAGEVLAMRPLLVHASSKASGNSRRRLLHLVFGPREPGYGLQWRHAA